MQFEAGRVSFQLDLVGYQFPHLTSQEWDSDWLRVRVRLQHAARVWKLTDPALTTFEVQG
ncbi:WapI family immunity protein [Deinococcus peraridilitoris]|nr:hypothetical protein [Deinococcus peraridilitoris]